MHSFLLRLQGLVIFILFASTLSYPMGKIKFNRLSTQHGLSNSAVTCIYQDIRGFMWFGTQDGLNRYDGYNFKVFKNEPGNLESLSDNFIFSIYENNNGDLYIETISGKLHQYNPLSESFSIISRDSIDLNKCKSNSVLAFYNDSNNIRWSGELSTPSGLKKENPVTHEPKVFLHNNNDPFSISDNRVFSVMEDGDGNIWVGTRDGLNMYENKSGNFIRYKNDPANPQSISDNWIWPVFQDSRGNMWIGTKEGGLNHLDMYTGKFTSYKFDALDPTSISDNWIFSIFEDRGGVIWIGTNNGGLNYFHHSTLAFENYIYNADEKSISSNNVNSIHVDRSGNYWIGTSEGGLDKFDYQNKFFKNFRHSKSNPNSLIDNNVHIISEDSYGLLWLGTFSSGLDIFNPKTETFTHYKCEPDNANSLSDSSIYSIVEDKQGIMWIGTNSGGLNRFDRKTGLFTTYKHDENDTTSISSNKTWSVFEDYKGILWIGTFGNGVSVFDKDSETFIHYKNIPNDSTSISSDNVVRIFEDSNHNMWFGTTGGLNRFFRDSGTFKSYHEADGLANENVYGILEDSNGYLWMSTNNGISKFDPIAETFKNYTSHDGLQGNEFNQNSFAADRKTGRLLFGGLDGVTIFHPDNIKENLIEPPIEFTEYSRYNTDDEEGKPIIEKGISVIDTLFLSYKDNIINLGFSALSYQNNSMNQYRYKLEGFNENWIQLGNEHSVTFTNLSAGEYILSVTGSNNEGLWNSQGKNLYIDVTPPWWKTNFAYAAYLLAIASILLTIRRIETRRKEQEAAIREGKLLVKTFEAETRALEIENERKTKELEEARALQLSMLPKETPELEHLELSAYMRTATEVGGDYYDYLVGEDGTFNIAFGDATGHGLQAGTMVTLMKGFFTLHGGSYKIKTFFEQCTKAIKEIKLGRILMAFSFLKINEFKLSYSSAGMPPLYYYNSNSGEVEELLVEGMPLGAMSKLPFYNSIEKDLNPGDVILLFSDGLPEQMNEKEEMYDYPRFKDNFAEILHNKNPQEIVESILATIDSWRGNAEQEDDISLMVIKVK